MPTLSIGQSKCAVKQGPVWPNDLDSRTLSEGSTLLKYCEMFIYLSKTFYNIFYEMITMIPFQYGSWMKRVGPKVRNISQCEKDQ